MFGRRRCLLDGTCFLAGLKNYLFSLGLRCSNESVASPTGDSYCWAGNNGFKRLSLQCWPWEQFCPADNFGHRTFPFNGHDMNTSHAFNLSDLVDNIHCDVHAFIFLILGIFHAFDNIIGDFKARHGILHVACHAERTGGSDSSKDKCLFMQAKITAHFHEFFKSLNIIDQLGLDEISPGRNLFGKPGGPVFIGKGKRICSCAKKETRLIILDLFAALKFSGIPHIAHHAKQLDGIHVENTLSAGMIAELLVITGKAEQVFQTKGTGTEDVTLHADTVPVATGHLDDRLNSF